MAAPAAEGAGLVACRGGEGDVEGDKAACGDGWRCPQSCPCWHMHPAVPPRWCGDGEGAPGQGILPVFSAGFFPPCSNAAEQGVLVVLCRVVLARDGAARVVLRRGRTDGRTDVLLLSLSFACQPRGCLPALDPSRGCSPLPGLPLRALARSKHPRCPRLSPALPEPRSPSRWCGVCVMGGSRTVSRAGCLDPERFRM